MYNTLISSYLEPALTAGMPTDGYRPDPTSYSNKDRLYIAYYKSDVHRNSDRGVDTALLLVPKKPKDPRAFQSWQFGVTKHGQESWTYRCKQCRNRSSRLGALLLLGKVGNGFSREALNSLLSKVFIVEEDDAWGSSNWTKDAVQTLIEHEVIAPLENGAGAREVWDIGHEFFCKFEYEAGMPVPTCNQRGKVISPEIR